MAAGHLPHRQPTEALAVRMAAGLMRSHGESSILHAYRLFERAAGRRDIARADLYHAVWSVLRYGERTRSDLAVVRHP